MKTGFRLGILGIAAVAAVSVWSHSVRANETLGDKVDDAATEVKKTGRSVKRKTKKAVRKAQGKDNVVDDVKDRVDEAGGNIKDELKK